MITAILFDLGNTLVRYWQRPESPAVMCEAFTEVEGYLRQEGLLRISPEEMWRRIEKSNYALPRHRVFPLRERLARIFEVPLGSDDRLMAMCRRFMVPIFGRGWLYPDTLSTLEVLRDKGFKTAIVSNTPWGSPAALWRQEIECLGLRERVDVDVFCDDVGWRKPAPQIFEYALQKLGVEPRACLFVGDEPRWDLVGPRALGIEAVLIDRVGTMQVAGEEPIHSLDDLWDRL